MRVTIPLARGQADVLAAVAARRGEPLDGLAARALEALPADAAAGGPLPTPADVDPAALIAPGTGADVVVRRGEVLEITQVVGDQGLDVQLFALADRRLRLDAGRTRSLEGARPRLGTTLWSAPPGELPLATIVADTATGHDLLYPACSHREYALATGCEGHASCREIELAAARAWGLDERDLHDPLNLWMRGGVDDDGALWWQHVRTRPGDRVALLAHVELLAVANACANDLFGLHRFEVRPVAVAVRAPTATEARVLRDEVPPVPPAERIPGRRLREPVFDLAGLAPAPATVELPSDAAALLAHHRAGGALGRTDGEIVRAALFRWWSATEADVAFARER